MTTSNAPAVSAPGTRFAPVGKPLEPLAESVFAGYWTFRHYFRIGGFLTQIFLTWLWFFIYAYLLALLIGTVYRRYR